MVTPGERRRPSSQRPALVTAAVSGLVLIASSLFQPPSGPKVGSATGEHIRMFVSVHTGGFEVAATWGMAAVIAVIVFTTALAHIARSTASDSLLPQLIAAAGILIALVLLLDTAANAMPALLPDLIDTQLGKVNDTTVVSWYGLTGFTHFLGDLQMAPVALAITSFSLAARRADLLPRWLPWLGLVVGACAVLGTIGVTTAGSILYWFWFAGLLGWALWILLVSVTFGLRAWRTRAVPVVAPAASGA